MHLCDECGSNYVKPKSSLPPVLLGLFELLKMATLGKLSQMVSSKQKPIGKPPCPTCGMSIQDIIKTSRLGCGDCYNYYKQELIPVLMQAHKIIEHKGKRPKSVSREEEIRTLELQLKQAVDQEQYEKAQEIKKKLDGFKL